MKDVPNNKVFAKYDISYSFIRENYPDNIDTRELFDEWVRHVRNLHQGDLIDIIWFVHVDNTSFTPNFTVNLDCSDDENEQIKFLRGLTDKDTGELLDLDKVPVFGSVKGVDFIESSTGWCPSLLQENVSIDWLVEQANKKQYQ